MMPLFRSLVKETSESPISSHCWPPLREPHRRRLLQLRLPLAIVEIAIIKETRRRGTNNGDLVDRILLGDFNSVNPASKIDTRYLNLVGGRWHSGAIKVVIWPRDCTAFGISLPKMAVVSPEGGGGDFGHKWSVLLMLLAFERDGARLK
ncbi:hypothetical protein L2E82_16200 [Cichorium intybus]|uniref:Uncharacterized protein n=1 Tax=Cichorium intybus TaxID=13427 RepID=A0ACB9F4E3_CICIN|nr:hypothetical protein L2E82_16200 [Cichorium intybus]